jgi:hypothetical protein
MWLRRRVAEAGSALIFREHTAAAADDASTAAPVSHKVCETEDII